MPPDAKPLRDLAWVDVETTGLEPIDYEIIEIAIIRTDARLRVLREWHAYVMPKRPERAHPKAVEKNGFSLELWQSRDTRDIGDVLPEVLEMVAGCDLAGQNPAFDRDWLKVYCRLHSLTPTWNHHLLDVASLVYPRILAGEARWRSLAAICEVCEVENAAPHEAMADIRATLACARVLMGVG